MANTDGMYYVTGDTLDECVREIEREHGPDSYTLKTREKVRIGAILGFGGRMGWKVGYVLRPKAPVNHFPTLSELYMPKVPKTPEDFTQAQREIVARVKGPEAAAAIPGSKPFTVEEPAPAVAENAEQMQALMEQIAALREDLKTKNVSAESSEEHPTIARLRDILEENEFSPAYVRFMVDRMKREFHVSDLEDYGRIEQTLVHWIADTISIDPAELKSRPQIIVLVGPTGVGKTTTVAKIASHYAYPKAGSGMKSMKVRMVGIDGYRIQAYEQLQHYANILDIPVEKVWNNVLAEKIDSYGKDWDVILIDTIGYSPKDSESIAAMRDRLELQKAVPQVYLTLTVSTKLSDMREIMSQFDIFDYRSLIVTKVDETSCVGNIISAAWEQQKSIAYVTDGQKVPRNIARATRVEFLKRLSGFTIDWLSFNENAPNA